MSKPVTAVVIELPKRVIETVWTKPAGFVDKRWLYERLLNINQHKIEYREARGQSFLGKTTIVPGIFIFDKDITIIMGVKIEKIETVDHTFYGVIPLEEKENGILCHVDWFKEGHDQ
jgi:hypothetical protein